MSDGSDRRPDTAVDTADEGTEGGGDTAAASRLTARTASETVLDDGRAALAVLSQSNMGAGFELDPSTDDDGTGIDDGEVPPTDEELADCESDISFEDRLDPEGLSVGKAAADYLYFDETRLMIVSSQVASFGDESTATAALDRLVDTLGDCTRFEEEVDGAVTAIELEVSTETSSDDADAQFDMVGGGSFGDATGTVPTGLGFSAVRVDNNITMVMLISLGSIEDNELLAPYSDLAVDRLVAVASGETPDEAPGPTPTPPPRVLLPSGADQALLDLYLDIAPGLVDAS